MFFFLPEKPQMSAGRWWWVGRGCWRRILLNYVYPPRKKLISKLIDLILVFTTYSTYNAPKMMVSHFPHASCLLHLPSILPSVTAACFWLVFVCVFSGRRLLRPWCISCFLFFIAQFDAPNDGTKSPQALPAQRASSPTPLLPWPPTPSWLLFAIIKRQPPKARAPPFSLFFDGLLFGAPNEGTNSGESTTGTSSLAWDQ